MSGFINKYATAATATLFLVVAGSGLAMFFHVGEDLVKEMHEWLSVVMITAVAVHIYKNWKPLVTYVRRRTILAPLALTVIAAAAFIVPAAMSGGEDPRRQIFQALQNAKLTAVGEMLDVAPDELADKLKTRGFVIASNDQRLSEIAQASNKPPMAAVMTVFGGGGGR